MKKNLFILTPIILLFGLMLTFSACQQEDCAEQMPIPQKPAPSHLSFHKIRNTPIKFEAPRALKKPGKIYLKDNYLFINEIGEGLHVIDNSNKSNPTKLGFISIDGNVDIAIAGNILFADNYTDLLSIDISNFENVKVLQRVEDVFEDKFHIDSVKGVWVDWEYVEGSNCEQGYWKPVPVFNAGSRNDLPVDDGGAIPTGAPDAAGGGQGGSMARFSLSSAYLYVLSLNTIKIYNITSPTQIKHEASVEAGWGLETLWAYEDKLFVGANNGMHIFDNSNPVLPVKLSTYEHIIACDPVVVEGDLAYVTLRTSETDFNCNRGFNQLEIVDISDPYKPVQVAVYPMFNPHGLGIDEGTLFLCDGDEGLKVFDVKDSKKIEEIQHYQGINSIDVIPANKILLMIGDDGFYQYDYSDLNNIKLLSKILVD